MVHTRESPFSMNAHQLPAPKTKVRPDLGCLLLTVAVIAAVHLLSLTAFRIPDPSIILLVVVVCSAFGGGLRAGLVSAVTASAYALYVFSTPQQLFHYRDDDLRRVIVWSVVALVTALTVGSLKRRAEGQRGEEEIKRRNEELERRVSERVAQLVAAPPESETDITERKRLQKDLQDSEVRFRRLFETAQDGILLLDADTGQITEVNPFLIAMLGYPRAEFLGKMLWQIGSFKDIEASRVAFEELQQKEYIRYENLPLETRRGQLINVEFVSNVYTVDAKKVIQCNIRDITARKQTEEALRQAHEKLRSWVSELEQRHREMGLLNEMSDLLQVCLTVEEAYPVITQFAPQLFPSEPGLLGMLDVSKSLVDPIVVWGGPTTSPAKQPFAVDECWALRLGRLHRVEDTPTGLLCTHVSLPLPSAYLCLPLSAQNETMGLLHLREPRAVPGRVTGSRQQLAVTLGRQIELALANLRLRETLREQSIRDPLTGLFNRRYMEESLAREVFRAIRGQHPLSVIMLDLDRFKEFNDTFGHEAGDVLLREVGKLLQAHVRAGDIACRYGGEEFTLIVADASLEVTLQRAERLRDLVKQLSAEYQGRSLGPLTISAGVAVFPLHGSSGEDVLRAADAALYRAKAEGRDRVVVAQGIGQ